MLRKAQGHTHQGGDENQIRVCPETKPMLLTSNYTSSKRRIFSHYTIKRYQNLIIQSSSMLADKYNLHNLITEKYFMLPKTIV